MEQLSAGQRARVRRLAEPRELSPDEEGGELNIVPFLDIIVNILIFVLATVAVTFTADIQTTPPASGGSGIRKDVKSEALNLTVLIVNNGFSVKASGGNVAPGCTGVGPGIAIPKQSGRYDYKSLNDCAARLKHSNSEFEDEDQVYIGANPNTPYGTLIATIDSLRNGPKKELLFSSVNFKVAK